MSAQNDLGFPYGVPARELPEGCSPPETWPEFGHAAQPVSICAREEVGEAPKGVRWSLWPLTFEEYVSDTEPDLEASRRGALARNRIVYWKRLSPVPGRGWRSSARPWRIDGYVRLEPGDLTEHWATDAKRHLRKWRQIEARYRIEEIPWEEYKETYKKSGVGTRMGADLIDILARKRVLPASAPHIELWGVRDTEGRLIAGTGILYSPTRLSTVREAPFSLPEGQQAGAPSALMEFWMHRARSKGMRYAVSTHFWQPSDPRSWKGFSQFKSRFGFSYVAYPPLLSKFVGGKLF